MKVPKQVLVRQVQGFKKLRGETQIINMNKADK